MVDHRASPQRRDKEVKQMTYTLLAIILGAAVGAAVGIAEGANAED